MNNEFVPYEQSVELKELGFDEPCFGSYQLIENRDYENGLKINHIIGLNTLNGIRNHNYKDEITNAPTFSQAFRWFRENHNLHHEIEYNGYEYVGYVSGMTANIFKTYEEAELACLKKLIEIVKSK